MVILNPEQSGLKALLERILDKGVVVEAAVRTSLADIDLLGIGATIILSSFRTAAEIGLDFPLGTYMGTPAWKDMILNQSCPVCGMESRAIDLKEEGCPWCGWNRRTRE